MKRDNNTLAKHACMYAIDLWAMLSVIWIAGEPITDMTTGEFCLLKGIGFTSLGLCLLVGKRLDKAGLLPDIGKSKDSKI